jgi:two-component system phosphate regulon sensor histidine kinase PhoR
MGDAVLTGYGDGQEIGAPPLAPVPPPPFHPVRVSRVSQSTEQAVVLPLSTQNVSLSASEQLRLLRQVGQSFVAATSEREVWRIFTHTLREACHFAACSVLMVDDAGNYTLSVIACRPLSQHFLQQNVERLAFEVLRSGLPPVKLPQLAARQALDAPDEISSAFQTRQPPAERIESFISHPLVSKGKMIGLLGLADESWGIFDRDHEEFLATLADYLAIAVENVRLREAEQGLWEEVHLEHQRLAHVITTMAEGLLILDEMGMVHMMNPMARTLLARAGLKVNDGAIPLTALLDASDDPWLKGLGQVLEQARRCHEEASAELLVGITSESVPFTLNINASPYHDADGRLAGAVAVLNDITDRKQIEKWKDEFLSSVSHELRTPLTPIKGYTQHLLRRVERRLAETASETGDGHVRQAAPESYEHHCLEIIQSEAEHLERLVNNLLDFSLLQRGALQLHVLEFDLAELLKQMVQSIQASAEQHRLTLHLLAQDTRASADRERIRVIIGNLIDNAIKYSPNGGPVTITLLESASELIVAVSDQGIGIASEQVDCLFDRFQRPHVLGPHQYGGIGVSLYLAHAIMKLHGGRIWAESQHGQNETGTTFAFALPRVKVEATAKTELPQG